MQLLTQMEIQVTVKEINVKTIYTTNEGQVKLHPIEIITKKDQQSQAIYRLETLQTNYYPTIELSKFNHYNNINQQRSSSTKTDKLSNQRHFKSSLPKQKHGFMSSNQSQSPFCIKLNSHKEILTKLLIQLSPYTLSQSSQNKELLKLNLIITKGSSLNSIHQKLQQFGSQCLEGLLVQRIYDLNNSSNNNNKQVNARVNYKVRKNSQQNNDKLSSSNKSNLDHIPNQNPNNGDTNRFKNIKLQNTQFQITQVHKLSIQKTNQNVGNSTNHTQTRGKLQQQSFSLNPKKSVQNQNYACKVANSSQQSVRYEVLNRISQLSQVNQHFNANPRPITHNKDPITQVKNSINFKKSSTEKDQSSHLLNNFVQERNFMQQNANK